MITFLPKMPDRLVPFFKSQAATEQSESAYDRYCEVYFERLGDGFYSQHQAAEFAEALAVYSMCLGLQRVINFNDIGESK